MARGPACISALHPRALSACFLPGGLPAPPALPAAWRCCSKAAPSAFTLSPAWMCAHDPSVRVLWASGDLQPQVSVGCHVQGKKEGCVERVHLAQQTERLLPAGRRGEQGPGPWSPGAAQPSRVRTERDRTRASPERAQGAVRAQGQRAVTGLEPSGDGPVSLLCGCARLRRRKRARGWPVGGGPRLVGALPGGGSGWGDSRGGRSPVFGVITEGGVTRLQGQAARGRPRRALCANRLGFTPRVVCWGGTLSDMQVVGSSTRGKGVGPGGGKEARAPALGRNLEKLEWGQK